MQFTTPVPIISQEPKIDHHSKIFLVGSCFVENIGEKFDYYKFINFRNPFGILYHPRAIENLIQKAFDGYKYTTEDIFLNNERWHCFDAHSNLSDPNKEELLKRLNYNLEETKSFLTKASHIIITLGTSWFYTSMNTNNFVANCHKLPQKQFTKSIAGVSEIERSLETLNKLIQNINSKGKIIFTVSPVRHIKEGVIENQRSKAHLITAVHTLIERFPESTSYFPSYELVMDELRDYRFYGEDMLHPNPTAINYIWEKFREIWISSDSAATLKLIEEIQTGLSHRPFNASSEAHKNFLIGLRKKVSSLKTQFPYINF